MNSVINSIDNLRHLTLALSTGAQGLSDEQLEYFGDEYERLKLTNYDLAFCDFIKNPLPIIKLFDSGQLRPLLSKQKEVLKRLIQFGWNKVEILEDAA